MFKVHKSLRSIIITSLLLVATAVTATASWTDYLNPFSYFETTTSIEREALPTELRAPSESPSLTPLSDKKDKSETLIDELITTTSYPFTATTGVALEDMSSGTTTLVAASSDDGSSSLTNFGFDYWYDGVRYSQFTANANGWIKLGTTITGSSWLNTNFNTTTDAPKIAPYWDDLWVGTNGKVHSKIVGTAPDRKLVIEWQNITVPRPGAATTGAATFQLWIYEPSHSTTPSRIQFVYGSGMVVNSGGYTVGLQAGTATNIASVSTSTSTVSYSTANNTQTGAITSGTSYYFSPANTPLAPSSAVISNVGTTSLNLSFTDNSTNEAGFPIYISSDNITFSYLGQLGSLAGSGSSTGAVITGLLPSTTYYFRIYSVAEGLLSTPLNTAGQLTNPPIGNLSALDVTKSEKFDGLSSTVATGYVWTDNVTVPNEYSTETTYSAGTGSSTSGGMYSFGVAGTNSVTDRALGSLASGSAAPIIATKLTNNTGNPIGTLDISYVGEQWRAGNSSAQSLTFQYQVANAGIITDANVPTSGWISEAALNFTSPTLTTVGAIDGNAAANRTAKASTIVFGTPVAVGQEIWIRWVDVDDSGADHALAVDDLSVTPHAVPAGPGTVQFNATSYTQPEGNTATITVNRTGGSSGAISVDYATSDSGGSVGGASCTAGVDYISTAGTLSWADAETAAKTFNVTLCNDSDSPETGEAVSLTLSNAVGTSITGTNPVPLNITDVPAMTYVSSTSTQVTGDVQLGASNQAIIGIQVVTTGSYLPLSVTQLNLSTNGSTAASDIANAKVYYTGTSSTFATGTQFGSTVASPSGAFNVTGTQALVAGTNYFWLAYDIAPTATVDNFVDAEVSSITVGSAQTPSVTAPAGNRQIKAVVTIPGANTNGGGDRKPLGAFFGYERSAAIYTSAELGLAPGSTIQNACWYLNSSSSPVTPPVRIHMKTTTASTFAAATTVAAEQTGATLVYDATPTLTYTAGAFQCIALTTPFTYTGDNLEIIVETNFGGSGGDASSTAKQYRYSTATSQHQVWNQDTTAPTGVGTVNSTRPNLQFNFVPPVIAPGNLQFSATSYSGAEGSNINATVNRVSGSSGTVGVSYTLTDGTAVGGAACDPGIDYINTGGTLTFGDTVTSQPIAIPTCTDALLEGTQAFTITLSSPTGGAGLGSPTSATGNITDIPPPFSGSVNVGAGEIFTSLTNDGGLFQAINASGATSAFTINITSDLSGETGTHGLNQIAGGYAVLIKPSGGVRTITSTAAAQGLITLNGADNVTIDGSLSGGTDRSLNLVGTNTAGTSNWVVGLISGGPGLGPINNTIKNTTIQNAAKHETSSTLLNFCIYAGAGSNSSSDIDNLTIENNQIQRCTIGIQAFGFTGAAMDDLVIRGNTIGGTAVADYIGRYGIYSGSASNALITGNTVRNVNMNIAAIAAANNATGIGLASNFVNSSVTRNNITNIAYTGTSGYGGKGIDVATGSSSSNLTIANNFISNIRGDGWSNLAGDSIVGMRIGGTTGGVNIWNNSINLGSGTFAGNSSGTASAALGVISGASALDIRNNILASNLDNTTASTDKTYAIATTATTNTLFAAIDNNDYYIVPVSGTTGGFVGLLNALDRATLANWQTASGSDAASKDVNPNFVSATDLHLSDPTNAVVSGGTSLAGVTVDYDNDPRPASNPDIGADEIVQAAGGTVPAGTFYNASFGSGDTLAGNVAVTNTLYLNGITTGGGFTTTLGCNATVSGAGSANFIDGAVKKDFCSTGAFEFPVGQNQYSKVGVTVTALGINPSSLTVTPYDATLGGFNPATSLSRNWNLEETGDLTANLLFYYDELDVNGTETDYRVYKREGNGIVTNMCTGGPCVDDLNNILGPINGVSDFSRWTGSGPLAPTAAEVSLSGRVTTADGRGIKNAVVVISGNSLAQPIMVKTGSFGYYRFDNLEAGEIYVVTVNSKRFLFTVPSRVVSVPDSVSNVDFVAMPEE